MKRWIGRSIVLIGLLHTVFGLIGFRNTLAALIGEGIINTVNGQPDREMAFWFICCGFLMIVFGALIDWCESKEIKLPPAIGWGLLTISIIGVMFMPDSGFWLFIIPSIGLMRDASAVRDRQETPRRAAD
ncbi:MAG: DUF6463 family protein [Acidobacteriota bacterium]|nr:DUF6463 family protein [Acidobacteriota bacterium]